MKKKTKRFKKNACMIMAFSFVVSGLAFGAPQAEAASNNPGGTSITRLSSDTNGKVTANYSKARGATEYQVMISKNKTFKSGNIIINTKKTTAVSNKTKTCTNYYTKVRALKRSGKRIYYGAWSKIKSVFTNPQKVTLNSVKSTAERTASVAWGKSKEAISGYQLSYSANKNFIAARNIHTTKCAVKVTNLVPNRSYFFRVRPYKIVSNKKVYGAWSNVKAVKAQGHIHVYGTWKITKQPTCTENGSKTRICKYDPAHKETQVLPAKGHIYELVKTVEASCDKPGKETHTCKKCGDSYEVEIPATGHKYTETDRIEPTEEKEGKIVYTCSNCGDTYDVAIPVKKHEHHYTVTETVEPTCTKEGHTTYTCSCGEHYDEPIAKIEHNYVKITKDPTCTESGMITYTCSMCKDTYSEEIPALGHKYEETARVDATCDKDGKITHTCKHCGDSYDTIIPAFGHKYKETTTEASCEKDGKTVFTCEHCGDTYETVIPATGHEYEEIAHTNATCEKAGEVTYKCKNCGDTYTRETEKALGHDHQKDVEKSTEATCDEPGKDVYTCSRCGDTYEKETGKALGHDYQIDKSKHTDATCDAPAKDTYVCSRCGDSYVEESGEALGHDYAKNPDKSVEATCTEPGKNIYTCTRCGHTYEDPITEALGHDYQLDESKHIDATCDAPAKDIYVCSRCNDTYEKEVGEALGHDHQKDESKSSAATCTEAGKDVYVCSRCGDTYEEVVGDALGHDYQLDPEQSYEASCGKEGKNVYVCSRCKDTYEEKNGDALEHNYVKDEERSVAASCEQEGKDVFVCSICKDTYEETTEKLAHNFIKISETEPTATEDGIITYECEYCGETKTEPGKPALGEQLELNTEEDVVYDVIAIKDKVYDRITGEEVSGFTVKDGYIQGGTVNLPQQYSDFTFEFIVDYNEKSTAGLFGNMAYWTTMINGKSRYEGVESNAFRLQECTNASQRGKLYFPWTSDQYNHGCNLGVNIQVNSCPTSTRELLPSGNTFWSVSMDSTNLKANVRIDGQTTSITEDWPKQLRKSFAVSKDHKFKEIRVYSRALSEEEQAAHYEETGIAETVPTEYGDHQYGEYTVVKESTHILQGSQQRTCAVCGQVETTSLPLLSDSDNLEDYLAVNYEVVDGQVVDKISGNVLANTSIDGDYFKGGTVKLPQAYSNFTIEIVTDYNEDSKNGLINSIFFRDNNNKYDGTENVFRLDEVANATSSRGSVRLPWAPNSYNSVNTGVKVQYDAHVSADYEYLPLDDQFWSISMVSDSGSGNFVMNTRIDGQNTETKMTSSKVIPASFALNGDHKIKSLKVYAKPLTVSEQDAHYKATGITPPTKRTSVITDGLTDLGSSFAFERETGKNPALIETAKEAGTYTVTDEDGRARSYTIKDYEAPDLGIDNSKYTAVHILNELDELTVGRQAALAVLPEPWSVGNGSTKSDQFDVQWSTSDASVCNVIDGLLIPKKAGTVTITATLTGTNVKDTKTITIKNSENVKDNAWNVPSDYKSKDGYTFSDTDYESTTRAIYAAITEASEKGYNHVIFPKQAFYCVPVSNDGQYVYTYYIPSDMTVEFPEGSEFHMMDSKWSRPNYKDENGKVYSTGQYIYFKFGVPGNDYENTVENSSLIIDQFYGERYQTTDTDISNWLEESRFVELGRKAINCSVEIRNATGTVGYFITVDGTHSNDTKHGIIYADNMVSGRLSDTGEIEENENWISTSDFVDVLKNGTDGYYLGKGGNAYGYMTKYYCGSAARLYDIQWYDEDKNLIQTDRCRGMCENYSKPANAVYYKASFQQSGLPSGSDAWVGMHDDGAAKFCEIKNVTLSDHGEGIFSAVGESDYLWVHDCYTLTNSKCDQRTGDIEDCNLKTRHAIISNNFTHGTMATGQGFNIFVHTNYFNQLNCFGGEGEQQHCFNNTIDTIVVADKVQARLFNNHIYSILKNYNTNYLGTIQDANNVTGKWVRSY